MKRIAVSIVFALVIVALVGMMEECDPHNVAALYQEVARWVTETVQLVSSGKWR